METLFNSSFIEIDKEGLASSLILSTLETIEEENDIITAIEVSQSNQDKVLSTAWCFHEEIYKYSTNTISIAINKVSISSVPSIYANDVEINISGTESISGLLTKGSIGSSFLGVFWRFSETVLLQNDTYSEISLSGAIMSTVEAKDYYFLLDSPGEILLQCQLASLPSGATISTIDDDTALNYFDSTRIYFNKSAVLNMSGKTLHNNDLRLIQDTVLSDTVNVAGKLTLSGSRIPTGAINKLEKDSSFLSIEGSTIANDSSVDDEILGNFVSLISATSLAVEKKAPYAEWETENLKKESFKSQLFLSDFVDLLLSGEAVPEEDEYDFKSLVSKQEVSIIVDLMAEKILNLDICNDD